MRYIVTIAYVMIYNHNGEHLITAVKLPFEKDLAKVTFRELNDLLLIVNQNVPNHWRAGDTVDCVWINTISNVFGDENMVYQAVTDTLKALAFKCGVPAFYTFDLDLNTLDNSHYQEFKKD